MDLTQTPINIVRQSVLSLAVCCILLGGCADPPASETGANTGIIGKKNQDIGEFKPEDGEKIADLQVKTSANPYASVGAYGFAVAEISKQAVTRALQLFKAEHGRMPKDYDEFMSQIIKRNNIQLPVLPGKRRYQYDPVKYELVVVEAEKTDK
ncbi:MAG: hypothetical protein ACKVHR_10245 [Pirellulales bacterium]|jgi:hypothetical protein|tara:strand:- start:463 stop:921 length:459 start_codon:yes stop_codon:yes gene_type:complete